MNTEPPRSPDYRKPTSRTPISLRAVLSLGFGTAAVTPYLLSKAFFRAGLVMPGSGLEWICLMWSCALFAITFGLMTFHQSYAGDPRFRGRWMAIVGALLGGGMLLWMALLAVMAVMRV